MQDILLFYVQTIKIMIKLTCHIKSKIAKML